MFDSEIGETETFKAQKKRCRFVASLQFFGDSNPYKSLSNFESKTWEHMHFVHSQQIQR